MKIQTVFVRQINNAGLKMGLNLRRSFLGVNRWRRLHILSDTSATSVRRLPAATPKAGFARQPLGQRRVSRAKGWQFLAVDNYVVVPSSVRAPDEPAGASPILAHKKGRVPKIGFQRLERERKKERERERERDR